jgi:hypothetical protein
MEVDGEGGEIVQVPRALVMRQTEAGLDETRSLIHDIRKTLVTPEPPTAEELAKVEVRYYRLPEAMAADLFDTIPQLVVPTTWVGVGRPEASGLIFRIRGVPESHGPTVSSLYRLGGCLKSSANGGGFFEVAAAPTPAADANATHTRTEATSSSERSKVDLLVIRQSVSVHREIEKLIGELLHPHATECFLEDQPVDTWKSRLKPETTGSTP